MRKTKLSIYLAKPNKQPEDIIVGLKQSSEKMRARRGNKPNNLAIPGIGTLYYRQIDPHTPDWAESFFGAPAIKGIFNTSGPSAALLVKVDGRLFALTFGHGRHLLDQAALEERFGLRTLLNTDENLNFRRVDSTSVAGNAGKNSEQLPRLSKLRDFTVDSVTDTLDKATATVRDDDIFSGSVTGSNVLSFSSDATAASIKPLLKEILARFESDNYKKWYPWVDNVAPVKDQGTINKLEDKAVKLINEHSENFWTAPPDLIEWDNIAGFQIDGLEQDIRDDILLDDVLKSFRKGLMTYRSLNNKRIHAVDANDSSVSRHSWTVANCLYGETELDGKSYCLNAGKWFCVSRDYADHINAEYESAALYDTSAFPEFIEGENEKIYNEKLANSNGQFLLMDAKNVNHGAPYSKLELCDVLLENSSFIHVKRYSSSAPLSHLFQQGYNSAYLVKGDQDFVDEANKKIAEQEGGDRHLLQAGTVNLVIFAIICKSDSQLPKIPFFSRISYNEVARRIKTIGAEARICTIHAHA